VNSESFRPGELPSNHAFHGMAAQSTPTHVAHHGSRRVHGGQEG